MSVHEPNTVTEPGIAVFLTPIPLEAPHIDAWSEVPVSMTAVLSFEKAKDILSAKPLRRRNRERPLLSDDALKTRFNLLASQWKAARGFSSSVNAWARLPAYRAIIALGPAVVPLLLQELEKAPDHWFWALKELTNENPVTPDYRGNVAEMAKCWINWGKDKGYRW